jgi:hypothetical protein
MCIGVLWEQQPTNENLSQRSCHMNTFNLDRISILLWYFFRLWLYAIFNWNSN